MKDLERSIAGRSPVRSKVRDESGAMREVFSLSDCHSLAVKACGWRNNCIGCDESDKD